MKIPSIARMVPCCVALAALAVSSCSGDPSSKKTTSESQKVIALSEGEGAAALEDKYAIKKGDVQVGENGTFKGGKRSRYDGQKNIGFGGGVGTASYKKKAYAAPLWSGNKAADAKAYGGNTDGSRFQTASDFQGAVSRQASQRSRFHGKAAATSTYKTAAAGVNDSKRVDKPTDGWTDFRRRVYPKPHIMSRADYEAMTVEQTRSILGRSD